VSSASSSSRVACTRCRFSRNWSQDAGGAVFLNGSAASFADTVFADNAARGGGGAVLATKTLTLTRCLLLRNAAATGGAVLCDNCVGLEISNSILALNSVAPTASVPYAAGAAVFSLSSTSTRVSLAGCTLVGNSGSAAIGAGYGQGHGTPQQQEVFVVSCIVTEPSLLLGTFASFTSTTSLLADRAAACAQAGAACDAASVIGGDPLLVRLNRTLPAGALGPDTYWSPTAASPGNGKGNSEGPPGARDFLGNPRVSGGDGAGLGGPERTARSAGYSRAPGRERQEAGRAEREGTRARRAAACTPRTQSRTHCPPPQVVGGAADMGAVEYRGPSAAGRAYATPEDTPLAVDASVGVLSGASDPDGAALTAALVTPPARGTLNLRADGSFTYIPGKDFAGDDGFDYSVSDGSALPPALARAAITVGES
jgi:predicted outer membrane repeat protein